MSPAKKISNLRNLHLDEFALEPGQVIDLSDDKERSGFAPGVEAPRETAAIERPLENQPTPQYVAQLGRRISPLVSGERPRNPAPMVMRHPTVTRTGAPRQALPVQVAPQVSVASSVSPVVEKTPVLKLTTPPSLPPAPRRSLSHAEQRGKLTVQLGRFGDIINILPLLYEESRQLRHPVPLMVAKGYTSILEGVSYVTPVIFDGHFGEIDRAMALARQIDPDVRCSQVFMPGRVYPRREDSFARDSWVRLGKGFLWEQLPIVFDRRSADRERQLTDQIDPKLPLVLVNLLADSFKFPHGGEVLAALEKAAAESKFALLNLASFRAHRIYDLLGLFDIAACLVTADTATQHLATASSVPVVAFRVGRPWFASPRRANHILNRRYTDIDTTEIVKAVVSTTLAVEANIIHVWPDREMEPLEKARHDLAKLSWRGVINLAVHESKLPRSSASKLGDKVAAPYILDVLSEGLPLLKTDDDIMLYTNSDVGFSDSAIRDIRRLCKLKGACYGYRYDHGDDSMPSGGFDHRSTVSGQCHGGLDLFAFTRRWLMQYGGLFPDMLIGRTNWDLVFRDVVKRSGGGEVYGAIWHVHHESWWKQNSGSPGNRFNTQLMEEYRKHNDGTRPYDR